MPEQIRGNPQTVLDGDGFTWTLRDNGMYSVNMDDGWSTLEEIREFEGIRAVNV